MDTRGVILGLILAFVVGGLTIWWTELRAGKFTTGKQICVIQFDNGYAIKYGSTDDNWYDVQPPRIATNAQGASAEVWAYLSGKPIRPDWGK